MLTKNIDNKFKNIDVIFKNNLIYIIGLTDNGNKIHLFTDTGGTMTTYINSDCCPNLINQCGIIPNDITLNKEKIHLIKI